MRFRKLLEDKGLVYVFEDETNTYRVYRGYGAGLQHIVSIPARVARRDVAASQDLIDTALSLHTLFGS